MGVQSPSTLPTLVIVGIHSGPMSQTDCSFNLIIYTSRHTGTHMSVVHYSPSFSNIGVDGDAVQQTLQYNQAVTKNSLRHCVATVQFERFDIPLRVVA